MPRADENNLTRVDDSRLKAKEDLRGQISFRPAETPQPNEPKSDAWLLYFGERHEIYRNAFRHQMTNRTKGDIKSEYL